MPAELPTVWLKTEHDVLVRGQVPRVHVFGPDAGGTFATFTAFELRGPHAASVSRTCVERLRPRRERPWPLDFACQHPVGDGLFDVTVLPSRLGLNGPPAQLRFRVLDAVPSPAPAPEGWMAAPLAAGLPEQCETYGKLYDVSVASDEVRIGPHVDKRAAQVPVQLASRMSVEHAHAVEYVFEDDRGWVVVFEAGEPGRDVEWYAKSGGPPRRIAIQPGSTSEASGANEPNDTKASSRVVRAMAVDGAIFVLQTLDERAGQLAALWREQDAFVTQVVATYRASPRDWLRHPDGDWLVLTDEAIWKTSPAGNSELFARLPRRLGDLTTLVRTADGRLYVGGREGVLRLTPTWDEHPRHVSDLLIPKGSERQECWSKWLTELRAKEPPPSPAGGAATAARCQDSAATRAESRHRTNTERTTAKAPRPKFRAAHGPFAQLPESVTAEPPPVMLTPQRDVLLRGQVPHVELYTDRLGEFRALRDFELRGPTPTSVSRTCDGAAPESQTITAFATLDFTCQYPVEPGLFNIDVPPGTSGLQQAPAALPLRVLNDVPAPAPAPKGWVALPLAAGIPAECDLQREAIVAHAESGDVQLRAAARWRDVALPEALVPRVSAQHARGVVGVFEEPDGWIVLSNRGEFGGGITWYERSGGSGRSIAIGEKYGELVPQNVRRAVAADGALFLLQGVTHLFMGDGHLAVLRREHDHFTTRVIARYRLEPLDWVMEPDGLWLVLTPDAIWRTSRSGNVELVAHVPKVYGVGSLARAADGRLYVGGRGGVIRLTPRWQEHPRYLSDFLLPEGSSQAACWARWRANGAPTPKLPQPPPQ
jgi:hypothetical protein